MNTAFRFLWLGVCAMAGLALAQGAAEDAARVSASRLAERVRHELGMMPWYGVFDHLEFQTDGRNVVLMGSVHRPTLRDEAERRVKSVEGVEAVENRIRVQPLSPMDDRIRLAALRTLFSHPMLDRYALGAAPGIRLVVEHGSLTLHGVVATESERHVAGILAHGIPGVFQVDNRITVAPRTLAKR